MSEISNYKIGILGAGTWGMALAKMLAETGKDVEVWSPIEKEIIQLKVNQTHPKLPGVFFPNNIKYTTSLEMLCKNKAIIVFAVPSIFVRNTAQKIKMYLSDNQIIVDVAKGIESDTLMTLSEVIDEELGEQKVRIVTLSGPTHAEEVAKRLPTTIVSACKDKMIAEEVQKVFSSPYMRVYTNTDIKGIEICGAMKNIIALAAGISKGMGYGDNAMAALITRGLAEMERLGGRIGCSPKTFSGLCWYGRLNCNLC